MSVALKTKAYRAAKFLSQVLDREYPGLRDAGLPKIINRLKPARHSADFRSVRWFGTTYVFTPAQALIVKELWSAWENGTPRMGAAALLEACDMITDRVSELFKRASAWGVMVRSNGDGVYWLQEG